MNAFPQRRLAVLSAIVFVIATIAIPTLHLAFHALPHEHAGEETLYHHDDDHDHDDADHDHDDADHDHNDADHDHDHQPFDPHHGEGSAAHFSLAIGSAAATSFTLPLLGIAPAGVIPPVVSAPPVAAHVSVQRFRGPPSC